jgi:hypothetical protein
LGVAEMQPNRLACSNSLEDYGYLAVNLGVGVMCVGGKKVKKLILQESEVSIALNPQFVSIFVPKSGKHVRGFNSTRKNKELYSRWRKRF